MKRCPIGAAMLLVLLIAGLLSSGWIGKYHSKLSRDAELAADAVLRSDWETAVSLTGQAMQRWEARRALVASMTNDAPIEEIDGLFRQLEVHAAGEDPITYASVCAQLAHRLEALGEAHRLRWWNLL